MQSRSSSSPTLALAAAAAGFALLALAACDPDVDEREALGGLVPTPALRVTPLGGGTNQVVVEDLTEGAFTRVWDAPGATPATSTRRLDTLLFPLAGDYTVTLYTSAAGGGGTASASETVSFTDDLVVTCSPELERLLGGCEPGDEKCWTFDRARGAITVGPTPGSDEWYTSPEDGLVPEQYDDAFCFSFEGSGFVYRNNGQTINPWEGYVAQDYDPPTDLTWQILPGGGEDGETRIVLPDGAFLGVWDSGPYYDIVTLTDTELVVRGPFLEGGGWFELYFVGF